MNMHRAQAVATLAAAVLAAAAACAGCTSALEPPRPTPSQAREVTVIEIDEAGDGVQALTRRVDWVRVEIAAAIPTF